MTDPMLYKTDLKVVHPKLGHRPKVPSISSVIDYRPVLGQEEPVPDGVGGKKDN